MKRDPVDKLQRAWVEQDPDLEPDALGVVLRVQVLARAFMAQAEAALDEFGLAWHPDGNRFLTSCEDRWIRSWEPESGVHDPPLLSTLDKNPFQAIWDPIGQRVAVSASGSVTIYNEEGKRLRQL